jgi:MFS transporter, DHA2 family, multidrug resistance protein
MRVPMPTGTFARDLYALRTALLPWAIGLAVGIDYFDNSVFSFYAVRIAGGIDAPPDELVWSSSAYAVAAVMGILQQHWWVERIGHRNYIAGCLFLFGLGALIAAASRSSIELAAARAVQGYLMGPMLGAARIFIQSMIPAARRPKVMPVFLGMILIGSALSPLLGGQFVAQFGWQILLACSAPAAFAAGLFALAVIPSTGHVPDEQRTNPELWPYVLFALALAMLQVVAQQLRFELFTQSFVLEGATLVGIVLLGWFVRHQWDRPSALVRLQGLRLRSFRTGLLLYAFYYYMSNALGYLVSRFLEGGLAYPVEVAGQLVGYSSMFALVGMFVYLRYSGKVGRKKFIIVPGFLIAALIAAWMMAMPPDVSTGWLIVPLMLRGVLLMFIALPTAGVTFQVFPIEEYIHNYRIKNIVKQIAYSLATASIIIFEQHRLALHETRLAENASPYNPAFQATLVTLSGQGAGATTADPASLAKVSALIVQQATFLSSMDGFLYIAAVACLGGLIALLQRDIR